jgi:nicotinate phosphoribosyltransferase
VGERLITSRAEPVFGGVYKLSVIEVNGQIIPKMKFSENAGKITNPCNKEVWRFYDRHRQGDSGSGYPGRRGIVFRILIDLRSAAYWKRKTLTYFTVRRC